MFYFLSKGRIAHTNITFVWGVKSVNVDCIRRFKQQTTDKHV